MGKEDIYIHTQRHTNTHTIWNSTEASKEIFCDSVDGPRAYYAKWVGQRKKNTVWFHLYVESKRQKLTNIIKQKQSQRYREKIDSCQRGEE